MFKPSLYDYSDTNVLVNGSVVASIAAMDVKANDKNKKIAFKNFGSFTDCICRINSEKDDNVKDLDVVMVVIIIQDTYFIIKEINQFHVIIVILLILVLMKLLVNLNSKQDSKSNRWYRYKRWWNSNFILKYLGNFLEFFESIVKLILF